MKIPSPRPNRRARIEIIPLIDIIFFLLATFVMVSLSMVKNQGIAVRLPVAATSVAQDHKDYVSITITENGGILWNKEVIEINELPARLRRLKVEQPDSRVFINGDAGTRFENVVSVLDEARKSGITKLAIETTKKK